MKKTFFKCFDLWLMLVLCIPLGLSLFVGCTSGGGVTVTDPDTTDGTMITEVPSEESADETTDEPGEETTDTPTEDSTETPTEPVYEGETDPVAPPVRDSALPQENITLNAFLIHMTNEEERREMMRLCAEADIDILSHPLPVFSWPYDTSPNTQEWFKATMAEAAEYGLLLQVQDHETLNSLSLTPDQLRALAETYKDLPGFGGFHVVDEPRNPSIYAPVENTLREVCPDTFINVNFLPKAGYDSWDTYIRQLCDYGGLLRYGGSLSLDTYDFKEDGTIDEGSMFGNYEYLREAGLRTKTNTAMYVGSVGMYGICRRPSPDDLRYNMMASLAYGVKEIKFFTWAVSSYRDDLQTTAILGWDNEPTDLYYAVKDINKKIHAIGTHLAACDAMQVYHSRNKTAGVYETVPNDCFVQAGKADVILSLMEERRGDGEYIFVVNKDITAEQTVTLTFADLTAVSLVSDENGELTETSLQDGTLTLTLAAGDCALIKLPAGDFIQTEAEQSQNLALHAPVKGTSSMGSESYYLYNLTDGIVDSANAARLTAKRGEDQLLTVDLGGVRTINRMDLYPAGVGPLCGAFSPTDFSLLVSADGESWTEVAKNTEVLPRDFVSVFRFADTEARYVRICVRGLKGVGGYADIGELAVYKDNGSIPDKIPTAYTAENLTEGQNLALNKPVVDYSSTTDVPEWTCHHTYITDGDYTRAWASELFRNERASSKEWITVDLLSVYDINCVKLVPRAVWNGVNVFPEDYEIQVSLDGETFVTVKSVKGDNKPQTQDDRILSFDLVPARYVRLYATRLTASSTVNGGYCIEMSEMEVFGQEHDPAVEFPES